VIVVNTGKLDKSTAFDAGSIMKEKGAIEIIDKDYESK
jgi:hypothetical protein